MIYLLKDETIACLSHFITTTGELSGSNRSFINTAFDPYKNSHILQGMSYIIMGYTMVHGNNGVADFAEGLIEEIKRLYP